MELTLGPVLFEWKRGEVMDFYRSVADTDVDRVYVGEVVCSKKLGLGHDDIGRITELLEGSGKAVTLSTLAIVSNDEEIEYTRRICGLHGSIEANDVSVLNMLDPRDVEVFAGPHITAYNAPSVEFLRDVGVERVTFPVELGREALGHVIAETAVTGEVFVHGRVPLAFSWRCYASRAYGRSKAGCAHDCARFPDGMELKTFEETSLFAINGTSILSADTYSLVEYVEDLRELGAGAIRISPSYTETAEVVDIFRKRIDGVMGPEEGAAAVRRLAHSRGRLCNGWYLGRAGRDYVAAASR